MRNRNLWKYMMIITAATTMSLSLGLEPTLAGVDCNTVANNSSDTDERDINNSIARPDGFTDYQECKLNGVATLIDSTHKVYGQSYWPATCGEKCHKLYPNKRDLFVILVKPSNSLINSFSDPPLDNATLLQMVSAEQSAGGLGLTVHPIAKTSYIGNRQVISASTQKAVQVTESMDTTSLDVLGFANTGLPSGLDQATIYTARIKKFIQTACGVTNWPPLPTCKDSTGKTGDELLKKYIQHTVAHEIGHVLGPLAPVYNVNYGGNHYMTGQNVIMDQSIYYTQSTSGSETTTTFYIGTGFIGSDQSSARLK